MVIRIDVISIYILSKKNLGCTALYSTFRLPTLPSLLSFISSGIVVVYIFHYFHLYLQKPIKNKEEGRSGTTGTDVSQKDLQRGETNKLKMSMERRAAHCKHEAGAILEKLKNN